jgi:hypothetical protein
MLELDKIEVWGYKGGEKFLLSETILTKSAALVPFGKDLIKIFGVEKILLASELKKRAEEFWGVSHMTAYKRISGAGLNSKKVGNKVYYYRPEV